MGGTVFLIASRHYRAVTKPSGINPTALMFLGVPLLFLDVPPIFDSWCSTSDLHDDIFLTSFKVNDTRKSVEHAIDRSTDRPTGSRTDQ